MTQFIDKLFNRIKIILFGVNNVTKLFSVTTSFKIDNYYKLYFDLIERLRNNDGKFKTQGVFDLVYPIIFSGGSSFFPKILGTYEKELNEYFSSAHIYEEFIDIGCGEGYYVNGLAKLFPKIQCIGYDINSKSIKYAKLLKDFNLITNAEFYLAKYNYSKKFNTNGKKLVLIDIEGSEVEFATQEYAKHFSINKCDLIIEMHDFYGNLGLTQEFIKHYQNYFDFSLIPSVDDVLKLTMYEVNFKFINQSQKFIALRERGHSNHWLILKNKIKH